MYPSATFTELLNPCRDGDYTTALAAMTGLNSPFSEEIPNIQLKPPQLEVISSHPVSCSLLAEPTWLHPPFRELFHGVGMTQMSTFQAQI